MLTRLYVHNYRCFVNFELRLGRVGLLLGYNGAGKTSVFEVLGAIRDLATQNEEVTEAFPADTLARLGEDALQRFELDLDDGGTAIRYALVVEHDRDAATCRIKNENVTIGGVRHYWFEDGRAHVTGASVSEVNEFPFTAQRSFLSSVEPEHSAGALTLFRDLIQGIWILKVDPVNMGATARKDEPWLDSDAHNFAAWLRHVMLEDRGSVQKAEEELREVLSGFRSLHLQTAGRVRVLVARFLRSDGSFYDLDFDHLSDGERALIILYVVLHADHRARILCLDEPDNFVAIREIQPFLVEALGAAEDGAFQMLLISHSAEVIDFIGPTRAVLLERPAGGPTRVGEIAHGSRLELSELMARGWHAAR